MINKGGFQINVLSKSFCVFKIILWALSGSNMHRKLLALGLLGSHIGFTFKTLCGESWHLLVDGWHFTVQNLDQLYVLVSCAHKLPFVLKARLKPN